MNRMIIQLSKNINRLWYHYSSYITHGWTIVIPAHTFKSTCGCHHLSCQNVVNCHLSTQLPHSLWHRLPSLCRIFQLIPHHLCTHLAAQSCSVTPWNFTLLSRVLWHLCSFAAVWPWIGYSNCRNDHDLSWITNSDEERLPFSHWKVQLK